MFGCCVFLASDSFFQSKLFIYALRDFHSNTSPNSVYVWNTTSIDCYVPRQHLGLADNFRYSRSLSP